MNTPLQWRHNGHDGVSKHQPHNCLLNRLFRRRSKKTSKLRVTSLCEGNSPVTGEFPTRRVSNAENVSIWWRHHAFERNSSLPGGFPAKRTRMRKMSPKRHHVSKFHTYKSHWNYPFAEAAWYTDGWGLPRWRNHVRTIHPFNYQRVCTLCALVVIWKPTLPWSIGSPFTNSKVLIEFMWTTYYIHRGRFDGTAVL